ncbi:P26 [Agrotis ipsilon multiple nucleopolyhedrovirus]|uniref:p26 n=1 Tax=Agrotis ipsilon multiple nucleopolyhedrovirus TaxID=208013 RepID=B6D663_9ABAC|nr:P26 [Agrotis ipsilon multiple nucleopolyhedrovirus]ACI28850.1 P26 [Agrotis ipsilon multiple nucleopolyhedrovirus]
MASATASMLVWAICSAATMAAMATPNNVKYTVNHEARTMQVHTVDDRPVSIHVIPPNSETNGDDKLSVLHQFPGVATDVLFPAISADDVLFVQLSNGVLYQTRASRVYTNFHTHKGRMVYGQLRTFVLDDFEIASQIYIGAPIYLNHKLVSVVTCRFDDYEAGLVMFPVTGIRSRGLVSGQFNIDDRVIVQELRPNMSVYGRQQLPYDSAHMSVKQFALSTNANRQAYRDLPRAVAVFHNKREITMALVEGEFEVDRLRFDGPLITAQRYEE